MKDDGRQREGNVRWRQGASGEFVRARGRLMGVGVVVCLGAVVMMFVEPTRHRREAGWEVIVMLEVAGILVAAQATEFRQAWYWRMATALKGLAIASAGAGLLVVGWGWAVVASAEGFGAAGRVGLAGALGVQAMLVWGLSRLTEAREIADLGLWCPKCGYDLRGTPTLVGTRGRELRQCPECEWIAIEEKEGGL